MSRSSCGGGHGQMVVSALEDGETGEDTEPPLLRLRLLGGFQVKVNGRAVPDSAWQRRSARGLVKLLATEPGHRLHREQVLDILWPDLEPRSAINSFRQALHLARRALGQVEESREIPAPGVSGPPPPAYLLTAGDSVALDPKHTWIDADHFELLADAVQGSEEIHAYEEALAAYGGELLPEDRYEDWTRVRREKLVERRLDLLLGLSELLERRGDLGRAAELARDALSTDPLREDIHRRLMRLYAAEGSRHHALRQYQACRDALQRELDVSPEPATEALYQEILAGNGRTLSARSVPLEAAPLPRAIRRPPATHVVGRDRILTLLADDLKRVAEGAGGMVLVGGEAGVGKTRLAAEAAREAHRAGMLVLWGASYEQEGQLPYGPFVEALEGYVSTLASGERRAVATQYPELSRLIPSLALEADIGSGQSGHQGSPESERARLFAAMARMLADLAAIKPVLLVLDDLHAADPSSVQLLHHLARAADHRWLIVGTYREEDVEAGSDFQRLCTAATREGFCRRVDLLRLARQDSDRLAQLLLGGGADQSLLGRLYALSLGNPLFLQEMVRSIQEQGDLGLDGGLWDDTGPVPLQVRELIESRIHRLGEDVRRTLALASVAGMEFPFTLLQGASELSESRLLDALDRALETRILEERADAYAFRHPLLRAAIYERLSQSRRTHLHGLLAKTIERLSAQEGRREEVEVLAYHYARSSHHDKAILYLERAGDRARLLYANKIAEQYYRELLDLLTRLGTGEPVGTASAAPGLLLVARASEKLGSVLTVLARYDEALTVLERSAESYGATDDLHGLARVTAQIGRAHALRGTPEEGVIRVEPLLAQVQDGQYVHELGGVRAVLAHLFFASGRYREALDSAQAATDLARAAQNDALLAEGQQWYGTTLAMMGRVEEGLQTLEQSIVLCEAVGDLTNLSRALNNAGQLYESAGQFQRGKLFNQRGLEVAEKLGDPARIAFMTHRRGESAFVAGEWKEARTYMERAVAMMREIRTSWFSPYTLLGLGMLSAAEGDWQAATQHLQETIDIAQQRRDMQAVRSAQAALAELDILGGNPEAACARLDPILFLPGLEANEVTSLLPSAAWAHLEAGDESTAEMLLGRAMKLALAESDRVALLSALRVRSMLAARCGRWADAASDLDEALTITRDVGHPYAEGRVLQTYGDLHLRKGEPELARRRFEQALGLFERLGAVKDAARVSCVLAELDQG